MSSVIQCNGSIFDVLRYSCVKNLHNRYTWEKPRVTADILTSRFFFSQFYFKIFLLSVLLSLLLPFYLAILS